MRSGALAAKPTDKEVDKGRVEKTAVRRYRAGQAPAWAEGQQQQQAGNVGDAGAAVAAAAARAEALAAQVQRTAIAAPVVVKKADDPRLARLAQRQIHGPEIVRRRHRTPESGDDDGGAQSSGGDEDEAGGNRGELRRRARERERPASSEEGGSGSESEGGNEEEEEEVNEEEAQRRREALRERLRAQQQQREAEAAATVAQEESEEEEDSSEYTTDSEEEEEDEGPGRRLIKPVFVPKGDRETLAEREALEQEEEEAAEAEKARAAQRKAESRQLVVAAIAAEEAELRAAAAGGSKPTEAEEVDTDDDGDADAAFDDWKAREMSRIARDRNEREAAERAAAERERLKNMTEEERAAWEAANPKDKKEDTKSKWKFMQKYWHKGAFFQESADDVRGTAGGDEIFKRDYSAPTGEDKGVDKASLPKVMQVRNFGRMGRTKWTHLLAEDTSVARKEDEWYAPGLRPTARVGAVSGGFARSATEAAGPTKRHGSYGGEEFSKPKKFKT